MTGAFNVDFQQIEKLEENILILKKFRIMHMILPLLLLKYKVYFLA